MSKKPADTVVSAGMMSMLFYSNTKWLPSTVKRK